MTGVYTACLCFGLDLAEQQDSGFRYAYSVYQAEYSRNLIFASGARMVAPLLAGTADPRIRRAPRDWTDIDRHYQALRLEMMALFGAAHSFLNDHDPAGASRLMIALARLSRSAYHEPSARDARRRIIAFFDEHLRN